MLEISPQDTITVRFLADLKGLVEGFAQAQGTVKQAVVTLDPIYTSLNRTTVAATGAGAAMAAVGRSSVISTGHMKTLGLQAAQLAIGLDGVQLQTARFGSGLLALAGVGGGAILGAVAGISILAVAYDKLTASTRRAKEEQQKLIDTLEKSRAAAVAPTAEAWAQYNAATAALAVAEKALADRVRSAGTAQAVPGSAFDKELQRLYAAVNLAKAQVNFATSQFPQATVPVPNALDRQHEQDARNEAEAKELANLSALAAAHVLDARGVDILRAAQDRLTTSLDDQNLTYERKAQIVDMLKGIGDALTTAGAPAGPLASAKIPGLSIPLKLPTQADMQAHLKRVAVTLGKLEGELTREERQRAIDELLAIEDVKAHRFDALKQSWNAALAGMLSGTLSFRGGVRTIFQGVGQIVDTTIINMVNKWLAGHVKMLAISIAHGLKDIAVKGAQAAAGAAASVAAIPFIGWALAIPTALATLAGVLALRNNISSAEGGWGTVPFDQAALLHRNEMVLPAPIADKVRAMAGDGGGGDHYHVTIVAQDSASFHDFLTRHDPTLIRYLGNAARDGRLKL